MVVLYLTELNELANLYVDTKILDGITLTRPENLIVIDKTKDCVCSRPGADFCVNGKSIIIRDNKHLVPCNIYYQITTNDDLDFETAILWLVKSKFVTPSCNKSFESILTNRNVFRKMANFSCGCVEYRRNGIPIYCTMSNVVLRREKGLTVREVVIKNNVDNRPR